VLRKIFGSKGEEGTGSWRKWQNEELHDFTLYTGCNRRNGPDFGRVFLMLYYNDITQNTYVQSRTVTEIIAREKCGLHRS